MERKLATGGHDGHVRLWDPKAGKPIGDALKGHTKWVTSLAWEPIHLYVMDVVCTYSAVWSEHSTETLLHHGWHPLRKMARFAYGLLLHGDANIPLAGILPASMSFGGAAAV